ncbi:hypothetical protein BJY01DRAFT_258888 [Aspergillus pseudoustus]|uniref:Rootletin n=1 Tax=Aspergillus pseudoustus TaxID=1810923 RepID=A0ABR4KN60_9EURO
MTPVPELDPNEYDLNEELLLLQIMEATNDVASPNLDAVLDNGAGFDWQQGQRPQSPLLMERPQCAGIDAIAFSFAKPAQNSRAFSLQASKTTASAPAPHETSNPNEQAIVNFPVSKQRTRVQLGEDLTLEANGLPEPRSPHNQWKVVKRRPSDKRRADKRLSRVPSENRNLQVPEEALFQQLISRLRAREESEAVASHIQKEMETKMAILQDENKALHEELQKLSSKLRQRTNEAKTYKSQTDSWRSRLTKIKSFLNELGADYQNLRGEAIHFKAVRKSLDKERKEISDTLEDVKARQAQISQFSRDRRGCLLKSETLIATLRQELKHADERVRYSRNQLAEEKKRSHLLELYIQTCSRAQDKKLELVKSAQVEMTKKLEVTLRAAANQSELSQIISDDFGQNIKELVALVRSTAEGISNDKMNVQHYGEIISAFESRIDSTARQLTQEIEKNSGLTGKNMEDLGAQLQLFRASVSEGSALLTELSASGNRCINLEMKLNDTIPTLENFGLGLDGLRQKEASLEQQMERLDRSLSEAKLPEQFGQNYIHLSEKLSLENAIQQLSSKLKSTEEKLEAQRVDSFEKHHKLLKITAQAHQMELNAAKFESQAIGLREKLQVTEARAREDQDKEINRSRDQCKADFDHQLHALMMNKAAAEVATERVKEQLAQAQRRLGEVEDIAKEQRKDLESLLMERQKRIRDLEKSRDECTSNLARQEAELAKLRDQETILTSQQISLQLQLGEANTRSDGLEKKRTRAKAETQHSLQALQDSLSLIRTELAKKEDERQILATELVKAKITRDDLDASMANVNAENHVLYGKVQGLEAEIKEVRETLFRLDIAQLEQPLPEALAQLAVTIQSMDARKSEPVKQDTSKAPMHTSFRADQGTQTLNESIDMDLPGTKPIMPLESHRDLSPSDQAGLIVPFSSIAQDIEIVDCLTTDNEPFNISSMLQQTPERASSIEDFTVPARPEKSHPFADIEAKSTIQESQGCRSAGIEGAIAECMSDPINKETAVEQVPTQVKEARVGRKVSLEKGKLSAEDNHIQIPDSQMNGTRPGLVVLSLNGSHSTRSNRWTYSKRQRELLNEQQTTISSGAASSQTEDRAGCTETGTNKKARISSTPSNPVTQARKSSELYPRRKSPTRLASGSSRTRSSEAVSTQKGLGRTTRNSARRTRAEKYNARFSQGT